MGRNKKYGESQTATSEAQKAAAREYYKRKKAEGKPPQKVLSITMRPDEYESSRQALTAHGLTPLQAWRRLMSELKAEPIPTEAEADSQASTEAPGSDSTNPDDTPTT